MLSRIPRPAYVKNSDAGKINSPLIIAFVVSLAIVLVGCAGDEETRLPGTRIPVLLGNVELELDSDIQDQQLKIPRPFANNGWPQAGGFADHANHHLDLGDDPRRRWSVNIGEIISDRGESPGPVVANGQVYVMDSRYTITALSEETGQRLWRQRLPVPQEDEDSIGGGLAYENDRLYVSTGFSDVFSLAAQDGSLLWRSSAGAPMRAPPAVAGGKVVVLTIDNQAVAFEAATGILAWRHFGISETADLLGAGAPALSGPVAIIPYSSGELFALRLANGRDLWSESLTSLQPLNAITSLADIRAMPVIDRGIVYAISHAGRFLAIDLRTGIRAWERQVSGTHMPWAAGDYVYLLSSDYTLAALTRRGGRVRWRTYLPQFEEPEDQEGRIFWRGPVLAGDRLVLGNNLGEIYSLSPYNGAVLGKISIGAGIAALPVVANRQLLILQNDGSLSAYR